MNENKQLTSSKPGYHTITCKKRNKLMNKNEQSTNVELEYYTVKFVPSDTDLLVHAESVQKALECAKNTIALLAPDKKGTPILDDVNNYTVEQVTFREE